MVTHPFHPLVGQVFTLVTRKLNWGEDRVMYYDQGKRLRSMPTSWTNAAPEDVFVAAAAGESWFHVDDLLELSTQLRQVLTRSVK